MATRHDVQWGTGPDAGTYIATLGDLRAAVRPHPERLWEFEARIVTPATGYGEPHSLRTLREALRWVEQELVRLANAAPL